MIVYVIFDIDDSSYHDITTIRGVVDSEAKAYSLTDGYYSWDYEEFELNDIMKKEIKKCKHCIRSSYSYSEKEDACLDVDPNSCCDKWRRAECP